MVYMQSLIMQQHARTVDEASKVDKAWTDDPPRVCHTPGLVHVSVRNVEAALTLEQAREFLDALCEAMKAADGPGDPDTPVRPLTGQPGGSDATNDTTVVPGETWSA